MNITVQPFPPGIFVHRQFSTGPNMHITSDYGQFMALLIYNMLIEIRSERATNLMARHLIQDVERWGKENTKPPQQWNVWKHESDAKIRPTNEHLVGAREAERSSSHQQPLVHVVQSVGRHLHNISIRCSAACHPTFKCQSKRKRDIREPSTHPLLALFKNQTKFRDQK